MIIICSVDQTRLDNYQEALKVYKLKTLTDLEQFLMKPDISDREKVETLYLTYQFYIDLIDYIESRVTNLS